MEPWQISEGVSLNKLEKIVPGRANGLDENLRARLKELDMGAADMLNTVEGESGKVESWGRIQLICGDALWTFVKFKEFGFYPGGT